MAARPNSLKFLIRVDLVGKEVRSKATLLANYCLAVENRGDDYETRLTPSGAPRVSRVPLQPTKVGFVILDANLFAEKQFVNSIQGVRTY